jgi:hypothetical protein
MASEIAAKLLAAIDPATGLPAITKVYRRERSITLTGNDDMAPDLVVGYAKGTRGSDESALGGLPREVFADNTSEWSGDHCMDHETVPGVLLSNRALRRPAPAIQDLAASILAEFGIDGFPHGSEGALTCSDHASSWTRHCWQGQALRGPRRLRVGGRVRGARPREGAGEARGLRLGGGDQEEAEGAGLHLLIVARRPRRM